MHLRKSMLATLLATLALFCVTSISYGEVVLQGETTPATVAEWSGGSPAATIGNATGPGWVTGYGAGTTLDVSTLSMGNGTNGGTLSLWNGAQLNTTGNITATKAAFRLDLSATTAGTAPIQVGGTFDINNASLSLIQNGVTPTGTYNLVNGAAGSTVSGVFGKWIGRAGTGQEYTDGSKILVGDRVGQINYVGNAVTVGSFSPAFTDITVDPEGRSGLDQIYYGSWDSVDQYTGVENVTGSNLYVGKNSGVPTPGNAYGELLIPSNKTLTCINTLLGYVSGSAGKVTVTGTDALWTNSGEFYVGYDGSGSLTIADGGEVSNTIGQIGSGISSDGEGLVTGSGSKWTCTSDLYVGSSGSGSLTIADGGEVSNIIGYIGKWGDGSGEVLVTGSGSKWTCTSILYVGDSGSGSLTLETGGKVVVGGKLSINDNPARGIFNWTGGTLEINGAVATYEDLTVPSGGLLTGIGTFAQTSTQTVTAGGQSQFTGGPLYTSGGNGYTISDSGGDYTLANATYNVQPGGALKKGNLWEVTATGSVASFTVDGSFAFSTNGLFSTLSDCIGADELTFGASTGGTININHQATIAALNVASTSAFVIGTGGKIGSTADLNMANASSITINIAAGDFVAGRVVADLASKSWIVNPTNVTLNVAPATGIGSVMLATSTNAAAMSTDGTAEIAQTDLDGWIAGLGGAYSIGYDGFNLLLNYDGYIPPEPGDSNEVVIEKLIANGAIVLPPGMTVKDVVNNLTTTTASTLTGFTAANTFGSTLASMITNSSMLAGWIQSGRMSGNNNTDTLRGQQLLSDYRRGKTSLWVENVGSWTTQDAIDGSITGYDASLYGIQVGADRMFGRNLIGGVAFGGAWATTRSGSQQMATDIFDFQIYGAWRVSQNLRSIGSIGYQYMNYNGMFLGENSSHIGNMFKMAGVVEYDIRLGGTLLTPFYGWEYYTTSEDAYQTGQFAVDGNRTEAVYQRCGARIALLRQRYVKMDFHSSWLHNFGNENIIFSAASGGTPLQLTGAPVHRDLAELGLDTNIALTRSLDLTLGYLGVYAPGFNTQSVNGLLRYSF